MSDNKQRPRMHAKEIIAWANGATIQRCENGRMNFSLRDLIWHDDLSPTWDPANMYRVKPQVETFYMCIKRAGGGKVYCGIPYRELEAAQLEAAGAKEAGQQATVVCFSVDAGSLSTTMSRE